MPDSLAFALKHLFQARPKNYQSVFMEFMSLTGYGDAVASLLHYVAPIN